MSLEQIHVTEKHELVFSTISMENVPEGLNQSIFKKHMLPVQTKWHTLIFPCHSLLSITITPSNARDSERTQNSEKKGKLVSEPLMRETTQQQVAL